MKPNLPVVAGAAWFLVVLGGAILVLIEVAR